MARWFAIFWLLLLLLPTAAHAIDPGIASGRFHGEGMEITFAHSMALRQGNEEGLLDSNQTMRVVISDVEVQPEALHGIAFLPVGELARAGKLRGLLLEFDPADRTSMLITVLDKPARAGESLPTITLSDSGGLWQKLNVAATRIGGDITHDVEDHGFTVSFSAPVFENKVTADLKGPAVQASEQVRLLIAREHAFARGDLVSAKAMTSAKGRDRLDQLPVQFLAELRNGATAAIASYRKILRLVVRHDTAVAILPEEGSWQGFVIENGRWMIE